MFFTLRSRQERRFERAFAAAQKGDRATLVEALRPPPERSCRYAFWTAGAATAAAEAWAGTVRGENLLHAAVRSSNVELVREILGEHCLSIYLFCFFPFLFDAYLARYI